MKKPTKINALGVFTGSCPAQTLEAPTPLSATKPSNDITIVFVTAYGLTDFHVQHVQPLFELEGLRFRHVQLPPGGGVSTAIEGPIDDADAVGKAVLSETSAGQNVVLVLHSTSVGPGLKGLSSILPMKSSKGSVSGHVIHTILIAAQMPCSENDSHNGSNGHLNSHPVDALFSDLPPSSAAAYIDAVDEQNLLPPTDETPEIVEKTTEMRKLVPSTYIACTQDKVLSPEYQILVPIKQEIGLVELASDHCPMVSHPEELVEAVRRVVERGW